MIVVQAAVEGDLDEAVLRRLIREAGAGLGSVYGKQGKQKLEKQIRGYNNAARPYHPWVVLVDLDNDECPQALRRAWLPTASQHLCFRVAVRSIESWLLADGEAISGFLAADPARVPLLPDAEPHPKRTLVEIARGSRRPEIQRDMVPKPQSGRQVGPAYSSRLRDYIEDHWRPDVAALHSDSLKRCRSRLRELVQPNG